MLDELFALADACAALVGAPITIEDTQSRVLAYSSTQDVADPARVSTIVGRRVPDEVIASLRGRGVFRRLARSDQPFFVPAGRGLGARLVVPVRAGTEWLGSIWAVVDDEPPDRRAAVAQPDRVRRGPAPAAPALAGRPGPTGHERPAARRAERRRRRGRGLAAATAVAGRRAVGGPRRA